MEEICANTEDLKIDEIKDGLLKNELASELGEFFKIFGDPTRIKILGLLAKYEVCVHEISTILEMSQSAVSHQLKVLRQYKLVKNRRNGKHIFYSLADDHVTQIINNGLEHIQE